MIGPMGATPGAPSLMPTAASLTDRGLVREENEDAVAVACAGRLACVADGMGGHARGAWASKLICDGIGAIALPPGMDAACEAVADVLDDVNHRIAEAGRVGCHTIGSTVVVLVSLGNRFACLWAGDSRAYLVRDGGIRQLTRDHSQVEELVAAGILTTAQARDHPLGNVVTRAIGVSPGLALDVVEDAAIAGDRFLLCSDGLTKVVEDDEIAAIVAAEAPDGACRALVRAALARGAPDNVSVVAVRVA